MSSCLEAGSAETVFEHKAITAYNDGSETIRVTSVSKNSVDTRRQHLLRKFLRVALVCATLLAASGSYSARWPALAHAQADAPAAVVSSDNFPEITVTVLCPAADGACTCLQQAGAWSVEEDGEPQSILRVAPRQVRPKTETTIFLDLYRGQDSVRSGMGKAIGQLIALSKDPPAFFLERDYFSVITPGENGALPYMLAELKDDLGLLSNDVTQQKAENLPYRNLSETPLSLLLLNTLEAMSPSDAETRRALVVISDGNDRQTGKVLNTVINQASAKQIPIYTVYVPTSPGNIDNLKALADGTGGSYFASLDEMDWSLLAATQRVCDLTYRTTNAQAKRVVVTLQHRDSGVSDSEASGPRESAAELPAWGVPPPRVAVHISAQNENVPASDAVGDRAQASQDVAITWDMAPYPTRRLRSLGYEILDAGQAIVERTEEAPAEEGVIALPLHLENLAAGAYILRAWVEDELGLRGEAHISLKIAAPPTPFPVPSVVSPPSPAPTLTPSPTPTSDPSLVVKAWVWTKTDFPYRRLLLATTSVAALLSATAIWLWRRRPGSGDGSPLGSKYPDVMQAKAILHRINATVVPGVKQVVKLGDRVLNIPRDLYLDKDRNRTQRPNEPAFNLKANIRRSSEGGYELQVLTGEIWVKLESGHRKKIDKRYTLHNRCEIIFGNPDSKEPEAIRYRFVAIEGTNGQADVKIMNDPAAQ